MSALTKPKPVYIQIREKKVAGQKEPAASHNITLYGVTFGEVKKFLTGVLKGKFK